MRYLATLDKKRWITAVVTGLLAFLSGHFMQNMLGAAPAPRPATVIAVPVAPVQVRTAALRVPPVLPARVRETRAPRQGGCRAVLEIVEGTSAMITVALTAPCHAGKPVRLTVNGIAADVATDGHGRWEARLPAFERVVTVQADLAGQTLRETVDVAGAEAFQHVILAWTGPQTFRIAAEPFGNASDHRRGDLTRTGDTGGAAFEVFRSPAPGSGSAGVVRLSVDALVTERNCGRPAAVAAYQTGFSGRLRPTGISYSMPDCARAGETVRLQNLFRDMRLALR